MHQDTDTFHLPSINYGLMNSNEQSQKNNLRDEMRSLDPLTVSRRQNQRRVVDWFSPVQLLGEGALT